MSRIFTITQLHHYTDSDSPISTEQVGPPKYPTQRQWNSLLTAGSDLHVAPFIQGALAQWSIGVVGGAVVVGAVVVVGGGQTTTDGEQFCPSLVIFGQSHLYPDGILKQRCVQLFLLHG